MNCPHCNRYIHAFTGLQEVQKYQKHLRTCRKNPANLPISDGRRTVIIPSNPTLLEALESRAASGQ